MQFIRILPVCGMHYGPASDILQSERVVLLRVENQLFDVAEEMGECGVLNIVHL